MTPGICGCAGAFAITLSRCRRPARRPRKSRAPAAATCASSPNAAAIGLTRFRANLGHAAVSRGTTASKGFLAPHRVLQHCHWLPISSRAFPAQAGTHPTANLGLAQSCISVGQTQTNLCLFAPANRSEAINTIKRYRARGQPRAPARARPVFPGPRPPDRGGRGRTGRQLPRPRPACGGQSARRGPS